LVLLAAEVQPVVSKLVAAGVQITAVYNHLLGEQPRVVYAHFEGHGKASMLASTLRSALALTATPLATPRPRSGGETATLDAERFGQILGHKGTTRGGVLSFSIPRAEKITGGVAHTDLGPRMGVATAINFQPEGSGAAIAGDFVLLAAEVQPVVRALRDHGIEVTAIHNHMFDEQPRLVFLHFWGRADADRLARGLRAALDLTNHIRGQ